MSTPKLKLEMDALRVETFQTAATHPARGTVRGNEMIDPATGAAAVRGTDPIIVDSANELCTSPSYVETCIFYTCAGCTTADPEYC